MPLCGATAVPGALERRRPAAASRRQPQSRDRPSGRLAAAGSSLRLAPHPGHRPRQSCRHSGASGSSRSTASWTSGSRSSSSSDERVGLLVPVAAPVDVALAHGRRASSPGPGAGHRRHTPATGRRPCPGHRPRRGPPRARRRTVTARPRARRCSPDPRVAHPLRGGSIRRLAGFPPGARRLGAACATWTTKVGGTAACLSRGPGRRTRPRSTPPRSSGRCPWRPAASVGRRSGVAWSFSRPDLHRLHESGRARSRRRQPLVAVVLGLVAQPPASSWRRRGSAGRPGWPGGRSRCAAPCARPGPGPPRGARRPRARRSARNSSRSLSSQRAWRSSSGSGRAPPASSSSSSSRATSTDAESGIVLAVSTMSTSALHEHRLGIRRRARRLLAASERGRSKPSLARRVIRRTSPRAGRHRLGHEGRDVAAVAGDLAKQARGDERMGRAGRDEQRLDARELTVHLGHLQLVLEVRHRPQALDDRRGPDVAGHVHDQGRHRDDAHVRQVGEGLLEHLLALVEVEERPRLFCGLRSVATTTSSKRRPARSTTSRWPLWNGSNDPGKRATVTEVSLFGGAPGIGTPRSRAYRRTAWS